MGHLGLLLQFLGWWILPPLLSRLILTILYKLNPNLKPKISTNATQKEVDLANHKARSHDINTRIILVIIYLIGTLINCYYIQSNSILTKNHYNLIGLSRNLVELDSGSAGGAGGGGGNIVKTQYRRLSKIYHPDKIGKSGQQFFIAIRSAVEILSDETKRWAYDRFGPNSISSSTGGFFLQTQSQVQGVKNPTVTFTKRDYFLVGAQQSAVFYGTTVFSMFLISLFRREERSNAFWRYIILLLSLSLEFSILMSPNSYTIFNYLLPNRIQYEQIELIRQLFISVSMGFTQLGGLVSSSSSSTSSSASDRNLTKKEIEDNNSKTKEQMELLAPLLNQLINLNSKLSIEILALQKNELLALIDTHPLLKIVDGFLTIPNPNPDQEPKLEIEGEGEGEVGGGGNGITREDLENTIIKELKILMKKEYETYAVENDPKGKEIVQRATRDYLLAKEGREKEREKEEEELNRVNTVLDLGDSERGSSLDSNSSFTPTNPSTDTSTNSTTLPSPPSLPTLPTNPATTAEDPPPPPTSSNTLATPPLSPNSTTSNNSTSSSFFIAPEPASPPPPSSIVQVLSRVRLGLDELN